MKKYKILMPILGLTSIAGVAMPLSSCSKATITKIEIKEGATKTTFKVGETFTSAGLTLTVTYSNGATKTIDSGFTTNYDGKTFEVGDVGQEKAVEVVYKENNVEQKATYNINVIAIAGISIKASATKLRFKAGETFTSEGLILNVKYSDGTDKDISSGFTTNYDGKTFTNDDAGTGKPVNVTFVESGVTKTTTYNIDVVAMVTVTFGLKEGEIGGRIDGETSVKIEKGTPWNEITKPVATANPGYRKMGWYDKNDHWWQQTETTPVEEDLSVTYWFGSYSGDLTITNIVIPGQETFQVDYVRTSNWKGFKDYYKLEDPEITGQTFLGWYCGNTKLEDNSNPFTTQEITVTARFSTCNFSTDSWENTTWICNQGLAYAKQIYDVGSFVGLTKKINLFGQEYEVRVIGENHDTLADGSGNKAVLTFELSSNVVCDKDGNPLLTIYANSGSTTVMNRKLFVNLNTESEVVWYTKEGQSTTCTTSCLTALKAENAGLVPKQVKKATATEKTTIKTYELESYNAYLFPLTSVELGIDCTAEVEKTEGTKYEYWDGKAASFRVKTDRNGNNVHYWIASQYQQDDATKSFQGSQVILGTKCGDTDAGNKYGGMSGVDTRFGYNLRYAVSFAFCI